MSTREKPLVSVVTPVYNGEAYLTECIESVLAQTYETWDYTIVNNCSTDGTLEIAQRYARLDQRIRVHTNEEFLDIIGNHNKAFRLISPRSKYCKVVSADDWLFPECITRLVQLAEENPSVGIVGSYQLSGDGGRVKWDGISYPSTIVSGRDICRWHLLGGGYVFGTPTSLLYRSDLIRGADAFYPNSTAEADTSACYKYLQYADFGFVHQVLSYERVHEAQISSTCKRLDTYRSSWLSDLREYGHAYLTKAEFRSRLEYFLDDYYRFLAVSVFNFRNREFWNYHIRRLEEIGYPIHRIKLAKAICITLLDLLFNPKQTIEKALRRSGSD
jgi:glycosyltransferase involved in cell wall biosynthesis